MRTNKGPFQQMQPPSGRQLMGGLAGGLLLGPFGAALGAYMARGPGTTGPGMLSNQGNPWAAPGNPGASWRGGYTAPGASQQGYGHFSDGTQHGPPATMAQAGGGRMPRTEGAIFNFGQMQGMGPSPGGVNALLRGNTINNGRLLGMGAIPWRQSGITFGTNPEAL